MSNYPPGVTGNEYAIGGATREWSAIAECPACGWIGYMDHEFHVEFGVWAWCGDAKCANHKTGFGIEPDEPEYDPYIDKEDARER